MPGEAGMTRILRLQRKWRIEVILLRLVQAMGLGLLLGTIFYQFTPFSAYWAIPAWFILFFILLWYDPLWRVSRDEVARFLSRNFPDLEESAHLLLKPSPSLNLLENLQVKKLEERLNELTFPSPLKRSWTRAVYGLLAAGTLSALLVWIFKPKPGENMPASNVTVNAGAAVVRAILQSSVIHIQPPAYTGRPGRTQAEFDLDAEEGAMVVWEIQTRQPVKTPELLFNDSTLLAFQPADTSHQHWVARRKIVRPGFYQLNLENGHSGLFRLGMIRDEPPVIQIHSPRSYTVIDYGMPLKLPLYLSVSDDYGVTGATLVTTISTGSGEAVKFREQESPLNNSFSGHLTRYNLAQTMDLASLGMRPGDELYFYVKARDQQHQETSSDVYIVSLPDTAELLSLEGLVLPVDVKPEFFRSQRQIIIETEQLLREKDGLPEEAWKTRSNNLGIDQKLLRLRYGKFLGEEAESNEPGAEESGDSLHSPGDIGNARKILDQFTDKHDNAEDATYFDAGTKGQLKATLTEMWNSELRLRTFQPREALPYEYKALRLLKELQQQSRAYVAKTGTKTTPLSADKRLTGDLNKILRPVDRRETETANTAAIHTREALSILDLLNSGVKITEKDMRILESASKELAEQAAAAPATYLPSLQALQRIMENLRRQENPSGLDLQAAASGLYQIPGRPASSPSPRFHLPADHLGEQYFRNLSPHQP